MGRKDNPDDARNYTPGDMARDQAELDNVHIRAYNRDKDEIVDQQHIGSNKSEAERIRDRVDNEAKRRGVNLSAEVQSDGRGKYKVITYRPKKK